MGLFSSDKCLICGGECGLLTKTKLNNGKFICNKCCGKSFVEPFNTSFSFDILKNMNANEIKERIKYVANYQKENQQKLSKFKATYKEGNLIWFDDKNNWFVLPKGSFKVSIDECHIFNYDEIIDFEVLEDGTTVTKGGLGKALVGGALFGIAGAIAGGTSKKQKDICTQLELKITTSNSEYPVVYLSIIKQDVPFKKSSFVYKVGSKAVQNILSKLQIIINELERNNNVVSNSNTSIADEIKKFKELLDIGAITQEEFEKKKKELLNEK